MTSLPDVCDGQPQCVVASNDMVAEIKCLVNQGNIRRLTIKGPRGRSLVEIPLRLGIRGPTLDPIWNVLHTLSRTSSQFAVAVQREHAWPREGAGPRADGPRRR